MPSSRSRLPATQTPGAADPLHHRLRLLADSAGRFEAAAGDGQLHRAIVDEAARLLGARRVLLQLHDAPGERIADARLPAGESLPLVSIRAVRPCI